MMNSNGRVEGINRTDFDCGASLAFSSALPGAVLKHLKAISDGTNVPSCPSCSSTNVYKAGFLLNPYRQHYECRTCGQAFWLPTVQYSVKANGVLKFQPASEANGVLKNGNASNHHQPVSAEIASSERLSTAPCDFSEVPSRGIIIPLKTRDSTNRAGRK